jgi:hypothetical protein
MTADLLVTYSLSVSTVEDRTSGGEEGGRRDSVHRFSSMLALVM